MMADDKLLSFLAMEFADDNGQVALAMAAVDDN